MRAKSIKDKDGNILTLDGVRAEDMDGFSSHPRKRRLVAIHAAGVWLTPGQARRIAKALLRIAKWAEGKPR